jgi:hypothetical protein
MLINLAISLIVVYAILIVYFLNRVCICFLLDLYFIFLNPDIRITISFISK